MKRIIYIVSGPAGVGKSTTAQKLAEVLKKSAYISGDLISHMPVSGREKPWESVEAKELVWSNVVALTNNFLAAGYDVVIDWVAFWGDVNKNTAHWREKGIVVKYVILWAEEDIHLNRDLQRPIDIQMGNRVKILRDEFLSLNVPPIYFLDNTVLDVEETIQFILSKEDFLIN